MYEDLIKYSFPVKQKVFYGWVSKDFAVYKSIPYTGPLFYKLTSPRLEVLNNVPNKLLSMLVFFTIFFFQDLGMWAMEWTNNSLFISVINQLDAQTFVLQ